MKLDQELMYCECQDSVDQFKERLIAALVTSFPGQTIDDVAQLGITLSAREFFNEGSGWRHTLYCHWIRLTLDRLEHLDASGVFNQELVH